MISPAVSSQAVADIGDTRHKSLRFAGVCLFCFPQLSVAEQSLKFVTLPLDLQVSTLVFALSAAKQWLTLLTHAHVILANVWLFRLPQLSAAKQSLMLLKQDKDYLSRQLSEAANRSTFTEEKVQQLSRQLDDAKQAREEMYEKYVASR